MLVGLLGGDESAPILVLRLWAHCQNRRQSQFENLSANALKALCRFPGSADDLEAALVGAGFVSREGESLIVCNWDQYNASLIAAWKNGGRGAGSTRKQDSYKSADSEMTSTQWKQLRADVIKRDSLVCQYCQAHLESCVIDHILPVSKGGGNEIANLCVSCRECNTSKKDRTLKEWTPINPTDSIKKLAGVPTGVAAGVPTGVGVEKSREEKSREDSNTGADGAASGSEKQAEKNPSVVFDEEAIPELLRFTSFPDAWRDWLEYKHQRRDPVKLQGQKQTFTAALGFGGDLAAEKMRFAMANGWKGWAFNDGAKSGGSGTRNHSVTSAQRFSG